MTAISNGPSAARKGTVVALLFLAVAAINLPRVPRLADYSTVGWAVGGVFLMAALVLAIANFRIQSKARSSQE